MLLRYPDSVMGNAKSFPAHVQFTFWERQNPFKSTNKGTIMLLMPKNFIDLNTVRWETGGYSMLEAGSDVLNSISPMLNTGTSLSGKKRVIASAIQEAKKYLIDRGQANTSINPYLVQLFKNIGFRNYSFTFDFIPFTEKDCDKINDIIKEFRMASLPSGGDVRC
jgi:hypothetical protein